jgi:hypothetical protein
VASSSGAGTLADGKQWKKSFSAAALADSFGCRVDDRRPQGKGFPISTLDCPRHGLVWKRRLGLANAVRWLASNTYSMDAFSHRGTAATELESQP